MAATQALGELMRQGLLLLLPLAPLSEEAVTQHIQHLLPGTLADNVTTDLLARAGGNPFFLEELVRALTLNRQLIVRDGIWHVTRTSGAELPTSIRQAVGQRLQARSAACRDLLRVAALFGRTFPLTALIQVAGTSEEISAVSARRGGTGRAGRARSGCQCRA